jgi:hypothetical protein
MMILEDDAGGGGEGDEKVLLSRLVVIRRHVPRWQVTFAMIATCETCKKSSQKSSREL